MFASGSFLAVFFRLIPYYAEGKNVLIPVLIKVEHGIAVLYYESAVKALSVF